MKAPLSHFPAYALFLLPLMGALCAQPVRETSVEGAAPAASDQALVAQGPVRTGAHRLVDENFAALEGKRVGLIVNHTALVDSVHLADLIARSGEARLTALFGPEHGIRGQAAAGDRVESGRDEATGVPIHSLYGSTRKPTPEMLQDVDALVFDIQDIGARFYTYTSTMGYGMQAAAEKGIPFIVLDRPNPIGGTYVSGFVMEEPHESFVGMYPVPIAFGLTVGELARMIKGEKMLPGLENLDLRVVEMSGWERDMLWPETGLPWVPPSPNIPTFETALVFPGAGFIEATTASEGRGTSAPFLQVGDTWTDGEALAQELNSRNLPGVRFEPVTFTPREIPGFATKPKREGRTARGVRYVITDREAFKPVETGVHLMHAFFQQAPPDVRDGWVDRPEFLAKLSGTEQFLQMLKDGATPEAIIGAWQQEVEAFKKQREPYLLYK